MVKRRTRDGHEAETGAIVKDALSRGVIVNQGGKYANVLRMWPPFVITDEQTAAAAETIEACITAVEQGNAGYV